jgi:mannan endo-1,6-alpha-mannosidase
MVHGIKVKYCRPWKNRIHGIKSNLLIIFIIIGNTGIVQWHESGEYWDTYLIYRKVIGDATYDNFVGGNMYIASYKTVGDFLGGTLRTVSETLQGKWNDDIAWWALACLTGAEVFGKDAQLDKSQSGTQPSWFKVAELTMNQMLEQLDNTCKGIYVTQF